MPAQNHNNNNSKVNGIKIKNNFLDLVDAGPETIAAILEDAIRRKGQRAGRPKGEPDKDAPLAGYTLGMIFEKNSTRTRVSFDMAMQQLGGVAKVLDANGMQLGRGETMADTGRVLSRYLDGLMVRTDYHEKIVELAEYASIPVINGLTDKSHPCQIMADLMTVKEHFGQLTGTRWAWLGDGNNVLYSIIEAASLMGFELAIGCPDGHEPCPEVMAAAQKRGGQAKVRLVREPRKAVEGANVIVTDTWFSMGQKPDPQKLRAIQPYQVTPELMAAASKDAIFLHCLPAHRGEEVLESVIDGPQSVVWDEAENRLHAQKSVLLWAFGKLTI